MPHRRDRVFVAQMVEAAEAALEFSDGHTPESFASDRLVGYAVVRAIQLIGQAARTVSAELQAAHGEIPWREMIGMRNVVCMTTPTSICRSSGRPCARTCPALSSG